MILAGFLGPKPDVRPSRVHRALVLVAGAGLWVGTWIFPTAFMEVMSYSCESSTPSAGGLMKPFGQAGWHGNHLGRVGQSLTRAIDQEWRVGCRADDARRPDPGHTL